MSTYQDQVFFQSSLLGFFQILHLKQICRKYIMFCPWSESDGNRPNSSPRFRRSSCHDIFDLLLLTPFWYPFRSRRLVMGNYGVFFFFKCTLFKTRKKIKKLRTPWQTTGTITFSYKKPPIYQEKTKKTKCVNLLSVIALFHDNCFFVSTILSFIRHIYVSRLIKKNLAPINEERKV